ncbi:MAG: hypothetical protein GY881_09000, partial [Gammaproteobacteria bacterium]|nr:hypothetical protein [Gammaproteobacteria bacterium]
MSSPTKVTGQGGYGGEGGGGGAGGYGEYDNHFGFYVGRTDATVALIQEMNLASEAYGKGGNKNNPGNNGCACVFFFPHQPPAFIQPGYSPPPQPPAPPTQTMTFGPSVVVGDGAGGGDVWYNPTITSDINGHLHAVYLQNGSVQYRVSTDLNQTWGVGTNPGELQDTGIGSGPGGWAGHYSIKTGAGGNIYVAYGGGEFVGNIEPIGHPGLWFKRKVGGTWSPPNINCGINQCSRQLVTPMVPPPPVSPTPLLGPSVRYVSMAVATDLNGDDHVYISYQNYYYKQLEFLTLKPNIDLGFVNPTQISTGNSSNASSICVSPTWPQTGTPHIFIAWLQNSSNNAVMELKLRKSTDEGATWGPT